MIGIANARMYSVCPSASAAWRAMLAWAVARAGVAVEIVDHSFPAPLAALWARPDLVAGFMCGWPQAREGMVRPVVAAPIPLSEGEPVYRTHFLVCADAPYETLADTFGRRLGWTALDSQSGYNAPRHHLLAYRGADRPLLYGETVGPLVAPRPVVQALRDGVIDVGPLDSYAYDLLVRHEPALMAGLRVVESTDAVPIPSLVGAVDAPADLVAALRAAFLAAADAPDAAPLLAALRLQGFAPLDPAAYAVTQRWAAEAEVAGYGKIG